MTIKSGIKWTLLVVVLGSIAGTIAFVWFPDPAYRVGDNVIIDDCYVWNQPKPANGPIGEGVSVGSSPGVMMRSGYSIGKQRGVVQSIETIRRHYGGHFGTPVYRYTVKIEPTEAPEDGWAVQEQFYENELSKP